MTYIVTHYPEPAEAGQVYQIKPDDQAHYLATMNRALHFVQGDGIKVRNVEVYLRERTKEKVVNGQVYDEGGWLEHAIIVNYENKDSVGDRRLCIGAIQRKVGADSEFHS